MALPPLITKEGLVLNNMMPSEGALGNYTPPGTASSEGISLLMRGMLRAAIATKDKTKKAYCEFLFDAACNYFFKGQRPSSVSGQTWHHSWIANGGAAFSARGPLAPSGDAGLSGFVYGRDPESTVNFVNGVGQLTPAPDICYQVVTQGTTFVWDNVFAELTSGANLQVDYYINSAGDKVFGTQKAGSFGQPSIPAGAHQDGGPGKIVLKTNTTGALGVCYSVTVPEVRIAYGELYEAWPMWRKLADNEISTAADAIHWFLDAFAMGKQLDPTNQDWINAFDRMQEIWTLTCKQESDGTRIFQAGSDGPYNNFPLTYSYAYGRDNVDDISTQWNAVPPSDRYTATRGTDGNVAFVLPEASGEVGSGLPIRYGVSFENKPLFLDYVRESTLRLESSSTMEQTLDVVMSDVNDKQYTATVLIGPSTEPVIIGMSAFLQFQQEPGDSSGTSTGDWGGDDNWVEPDYPAVPWPGRRMATVGDSITFYNCAHVNSPYGNRFENYGYGYSGWWVHAEQIMNGRTSLEHGIQPNITGAHTGTSFAVAGTKAQNWWLAQDFPESPNTPTVGPMYAALNNLDKFDMVCMMGGTNDLSGNEKAVRVLNRMRRAATDLAAQGKWVFLAVIPPRTRRELRGYTYIEQTQILDRLLEVNQGLRDWVADARPPNIFLIDWYDDLLGPNGVDPAGLYSHPTDPNGRDTIGNFRTDAPGLVFFHDGLHPAPAGARIMGEHTARVMIAAGIPARENLQSLGPLTLGPNLLSNPTFGFTAFDTTENLTNYNQSDIGWALGLGAQKKVGTLHDGFEHGKVPNNWKFFRATNKSNLQVGIGEGGVYTNFLNYMYSGDVGKFPTIAEYLNDSTWPEGSVKVSLVIHEGASAFQIDVDMPVTGNKNESFVFTTDIPRRQHGPWDNYGFAGPDYVNGADAMIIPNTVYFPGDMLLAESTIVFQGLNETLHSCQQVLYFYQNNLLVSTGSKLAAFGNHPFIYPPSDMDKIRFHTKDRQILLRSPAIKVPTPETGERMQYAEVRFEIGFDASVIGPKGRIIIKNPGVRRVTGGTPL